MAHRDERKTLKAKESLLAQVWKGQWVQRGALTTGDGRTVIVRSPGIENRDRGPDFLGANIVIADEVLTGDIELHVRSSDWRAHGHHQDPRFNGVILQVVLWDDAKGQARLENGRSIPSLPLSDYLNGSLDELSLRAEARPAALAPCRDVGDRMGADWTGELLDRYGQERFYVKSASFEVGMLLEEPEQVLYAGIMGALGYTKNKKPFQELAGRVPLRVLQSIAHELQAEDRSIGLQALLLGAAGILPSQCERRSGLGDPEMVERLEEMWRTVGTGPGMSYSDWHFFRMHPNNFPSRRLLGAGHLIDRYLGVGLLAGVLELVNGANPGKGAVSIEQGLVVPELIGPGRAREITVNVVLPFCLARAETECDPEAAERVLAVYRSYPRLEENRITRYLTAIFWGKARPRVAASAQRQQGLIHLYKAFCQEQRCGVCPVATACD